MRFRDAFDEGSLGKIAASAGLEVVDRGRNGEFVVFGCPSELGKDLVDWFNAQPGVAYAELDPLAHTTTAPNDTYWVTYQWNMYNQGALSNGRASNFGVRAEAAWDAGATGSGVTVAVVDSGVAYGHRCAVKRGPGAPSRRAMLALGPPQQHEDAGEQRERRPCPGLARHHRRFTGQLHQVNDPAPRAMHRNGLRVLNVRRLTGDAGGPTIRVHSLPIGTSSTCRLPACPVSLLLACRPSPPRRD